MAEHVLPLDLGVVWDPNAPEAVLLSDDLGHARLAVRPHPDDADQRNVVLVWTGARVASLVPPNDEAITAHRLWSRGLDAALWVGTVEDSDLVRSVVGSSAAEAGREGLVHHVLPLKECVVEVVARDVTVERSSCTTTRASACQGCAR